MRSIGGSVRSVRSVCVKESKISVNKIFVLFVRFVFKKDIRGFLSKDPRSVCKKIFVRFVFKKT